MPVGVVKDAVSIMVAVEVVLVLDGGAVVLLEEVVVGTGGPEE